VSYFVAIHDVSDPERFWGGALAAMRQGLPEGLRIHHVFPQEDGTRAVCLWEAASIDTVRQAVEGGAGDSSRNEFFEVDPNHPAVRGLPAQPAGTA
jgi:hypothetical protein